MCTLYRRAVASAVPDQVKNSRAPRTALPHAARGRRGQRKLALRQTLLSKLPGLLRERELPCRRWQRYDKAFACVRASHACAAGAVSPAASFLLPSSSGTLMLTTKTECLRVLCCAGMAGPGARGRRHKVQQAAAAKHAHVRAARGGAAAGAAAATAQQRGAGRGPGVRQLRHSRRRAQPGRAAAGHRRRQPQRLPGLPRARRSAAQRRARAGARADAGGASTAAPSCRARAA